VPRTIIGLDIGTHAVRAVEIAVGRGAPVVRRMAQVALPVDAVDHGEVTDVPATANAIKRLWREGGFRSREVVIGVANQRVVARQADLPRMSDEDLRSSLRFQVQELIPIPVEEASLDVKILDPFTGTEEEPTMRVLLVAAHRGMVDTTLAAVDAAGLRPTMVDIGPFALMRSLASEEPDPIRDGEAEVIVSIGAGVTVVVIHRDGLPQFVRIITSGGDDATQAIAADLEIELDDAEDLKRRVSTAEADESTGRAGELVEQHVSQLLDDIRGSVDFFRAQSPATAVGHIMMTGGGRQIDDLPARLGELLGIEVIEGDAFANVAVGRTGLSARQVAEASPLMATAVGLALGGVQPTDGDRRISLLPATVESARAERRQLALAAGAVGGFAVLLLGLWFLRGGQLDDERDAARTAEVEAAQLRADIAELDDVEQLERLVSERRQLVASALADDVSWTRLLQEVATVLPSDAWLTTFNGTATADQISFAGQGLSHTSSARWLLRVTEIASLNGLWLPSSTQAGEEGSLVSFTTTAVLTERAQSDRLSRIVGPQ